jgi:hypothetical protein
MKEVTGELNMSVIIILAVSIFSAFFFTILWPMIKTNFEQNSQCSKAICAPCLTCSDCKTVNCYIKGKEDQPFSCVYKG